MNSFTIFDKYNLKKYIDYMKRKPRKYKKIDLLETKLDEVANIYDALLMTLESAVYKLKMRETFQHFHERGMKFTEAVAPLEDQIKSVDIYYDRLISLNREIDKLKKEHKPIELGSISGIEENRDRVIKAFRTLGNFANITKDESERENLNNFMNKIKTTINLALLVLRHNDEYLKDRAFKNIEDSDIVLEKKDENII